jgi:hypothetical protein
MITSRLSDEATHLCRAVHDCFVNIAFDDASLLNGVLAQEFNPLTITVCHLEKMPSIPLSYAELQRRLARTVRLLNETCRQVFSRCEPVYCSYQLFDQPMYQTFSQLQAEDIYWNDLNLYLISKRHILIIIECLSTHCHCRRFTR